jgi:phospholipase C
MDAGDAGMMDAAEAGCMPVTFSDTHAAERTACTFQTGAMTGDTLGLDAKARTSLPIQHVIVVMKENRGFDHMLGKLHDIQPGVEAIPPSFVNLDKNGMMVSPSHATTTCFKTDPEHQWTAMHNQVNSGKMDGFVTSAANTTPTDGHFVLTYYDQTDRARSRSPIATSRPSGAARIRIAISCCSAPRTACSRPAPAFRIPRRRRSSICSTRPA